MTDLPILFSAPMIRAQLREVEHPGTGKTQTRRVITPQNFKLLGHDFKLHRPDAESLATAFNGARDFRWIEGALSWLAEPGGINSMAVAMQGRGKPKYAPGDRLWVRESWLVKRCEPCLEHERDWQSLSSPTIRYAADGAEIQHQGSRSTGRGIYHGPVEKVRPSIHIPRWASRLTLYVTDVRVERLQDISDADAIAEGYPGRAVDGAWKPVGGARYEDGCDAVHWYRELWDAINGTGAWDAKPWVTVTTFVPRLGNIDALAETLERNGEAA